MANYNLWKYCTKEHIKQFLLSLNLLGAAGWPEQKQIACIYALSNHVEAHYHPVTIEKRDGSPRRLLVPDSLLKRIQRNILHNILDAMPLSSHATAYSKGAGIVKNAEAHIGQRQILKLDIENFFTSITFPMVYGRVFAGIYFPPPVATLLTHLCCYSGYLPQGAPTSAAISNLVMQPFDVCIGTWCEARGITYTRYCDDLTFSGCFSAAAVKNKTRGFLQEMGFTLNEKKTRLITRAGRQEVTGIVVNSMLQVPKAYRQQLRKELYYCEKYGIASHLERQGKTLAYGKEEIQHYLSVLLGKINFVLHVNGNAPFFLEGRRRVLQWMADEKKGMNATD